MPGEIQSMIVMLALLSGVALQLQQADLWPRWCYVVLTLAMLGLWACWAPVRTKPNTAAGWWVWGLVLGLAPGVLAFASTGWRASLRGDEALPSHLVQEAIEVTGVIQQLPQRQTGLRGSGIRCVLVVHQALWQGRPVRLPSRLALVWSGGVHDGAVHRQAPITVEAGQVWRLTVRLTPVTGVLNPHGFDLALWWFEQGVVAQGRVLSGRDSRAPVWLHTEWTYPLERWRGRVRDALFARIDDRHAAGVLAGLALGDQSAIDDMDWAVFRNTGVAHLLAVSGLHITLLAWVAGALCQGLWRRCPRAMLWTDAPTAGRIGGLILSVVYALFAGWGVPAQRTVIMLATVTLLKIRAQRWPARLVWLWAAVVVVLADPWALLQAGFWLSFAAVGLLMLSSTDSRYDPEDPSPAQANCADQAWLCRMQTRLACAWGRLWRQARHGLYTQWWTTWGLAPLSLICFHQVSWVAWIANVLAIPWVSFVITPLALLGMAWPAAWDVGAQTVVILRATLDALGGIHAPQWTVPAAPWWAQVLGLLGAGWALMPMPWRWRIMALPLMWPLLRWPGPTPPAPGQFDLLVADVGQGSAVLVRTAQHHLLFDTGPRYASGSDAGERVLHPLLAAWGVGQLDAMVLSHSDADHTGGAAALWRAQGMPTLVWSTLLPGHPLRDQVLAHRRCEAGQHWYWDGVRFEFLHPQPADLARHARGLTPGNAVSCVLRITAREQGAKPGSTALLTGDIEAAQEAALVHRHAVEGTPLRSDILIVPHHGSKTSSTPAFLDAVAPQWAVAQAGSYNAYGHPAPAVVARYVQRGITWIDTPSCGAWIWRDGQAQCTRTVRRRYWQPRVASATNP